MGTSVEKLTLNGKGDVLVSFLTRKDLNVQFHDLPSSKINYSHFMNSSLNQDDYNKCSFVIFREEDKNFYLKRRF